MKKGQVSPEGSTEGDIEMMEGGAYAGLTDGEPKSPSKEDKLFMDFRNDVKRRIDNFNKSQGQDEESEFNTTE